MQIKKGDNVLVLSGREKGKRGVVERAYPKTDRVVIAGVNLRKRHLKPSRSHPRGGIADIPAPLRRSSVMIVCPHCSKPTRIKLLAGKDGAKNRVCVHCQGSLDSKND